MPSSKIRTLANVTVFAGWMVPAGLAEVIHRYAPAAAGGARLFDIIAGVWAFLAIAYGLVVALRLRRGISS